MIYLKQRIFAVIIAIVSVALLLHSHYDAQHNGGYYLKEAIFAPVGIVTGIFLMLFPQYSGKPETTRARAVVLGVFAVGISFGLYNRYLIDAHTFRFLDYLTR